MAQEGDDTETCNEKKDRKKNKTRVYSDVQLTALLEKSEIVIDPSKCRNQIERSNGKRKKQ